MILTGGLMGLWFFALLTLNGATFGGAMLFPNEPYVEFPPARPTANLLHSICTESSHRLRYPPGYFPRSGFSHLRRCGKAVDRVESWYIACCAGQTMENNHVLCCAEQAWKTALTTFCQEESSTMTAAYYCCAEEGEAMWTCFDGDSPNPNYAPRADYTAPVQPRENGFTFIPYHC
ncbi:unnamed protein product [Arctogadus glacialis]